MARKIREPMFINRDGEVHTKADWLWIINNDPMRNGTPAEVFERGLNKKLLTRTNKT